MAGEVKLAVIEKLSSLSLVFVDTCRTFSLAIGSDSLIVGAHICLWELRYRNPSSHNHVLYATCACVSPASRVYRLLGIILTRSDPIYIIIIVT